MAGEHPKTLGINKTDAAINTNILKHIASVEFYVDDVESQVGIASIKFVDGTKISFKLIDNPYD